MNLVGMKNWICWFLGAGLLAWGLPAWAEERSTAAPSEPLDLSEFTRGDFARTLATSGPGKLKPGGGGPHRTNAAGTTSWRGRAVP